MSMYYCPRCDHQRDGDIEELWFFEDDIVCYDCLTETEQELIDRIENLEAKL